MTRNWKRYLVLFLIVFVLSAIYGHMSVQDANNFTESTYHE